MAVKPSSATNSSGVARCAIALVPAANIEQSTFNVDAACKRSQGLLKLDKLQGPTASYCVRTRCVCAQKSRQKVHRGSVSGKKTHSEDKEQAEFPEGFTT